MTGTEIREALRAVVEAGEKAPEGRWSVEEWPLGVTGRTYFDVSYGPEISEERFSALEGADKWTCAFIATAANARPALSALADMCVLDVETVRVLVKAAQQWRDEMVVMDDEPEHVAITAALAAAEAELRAVEGR